MELDNYDMMRRMMVPVVIMIFEMLILISCYDVKEGLMFPGMNNWVMFSDTVLYNSLIVPCGGISNIS